MSFCRTVKFWIFLRSGGRGGSDEFGHIGRPAGRIGYFWRKSKKYCQNRPKMMNFYFGRKWPILYKFVKNTLFGVWRLNLNEYFMFISFLWFFVIFWILVIFGQAHLNRLNQHSSKKFKISLCDKNSLRYLNICDCLLILRST